MSELASYIFKPKHGEHVARKIIQSFCDDFLHYEHEGFYLHWRTPESTKSLSRRVPEGHIEFLVETENGSLESWSEICYEERQLEAGDLTESFFAVLPSDFWYTGEDGKPDYHFYERELAEIVSAISANNSRVVSFGTSGSAFVADIDSNGKSKFNTIELLDYAMSVPIVKEKQQNNQLALSL